MPLLHGLSKHSYAGVKLEGMKPSSYSMPTTLQKANQWKQKASDEEWLGNRTLALHYYTMAETYMQRHLNGDLYDPPF